MLLLYLNEELYLIYSEWHPPQTEHSGGPLGDPSARVFEVFLIVLDGVQGETLWGGPSEAMSAIWPMRSNSQSVLIVSQSSLLFLRLYSASGQGV